MRGVRQSEFQPHGAPHRGGLRRAAAGRRGHEAPRGRGGRDPGEVPSRRRTTRSWTSSSARAARPWCPGLSSSSCSASPAASSSSLSASRRRARSGSKIGLAAIKKLRKPVNDALEKSSRFHPPADIYELADYASEILSPVQLHGRGVAAHRLRWWSSFAPAARTWCAPSPSPACRTTWWARPPSRSCAAATRRATSWPWTTTPVRREVNQLNRIKLMIAVAKANLAEKEAEARAARAVARDGAPEEPETVAASVEVETTEVVG